MPTPAPSPADPERAALRRKLRAQRDAIAPSERIAAATALAEHLEAIPEFLTDANVAGYWAVAGELPLAGILGGLRARGQSYHLPVIGDDGRLLFARWTPGTEVVPNRFGIPEPSLPASELVGPDAIDVVLVPLLGFDRHGHRLGFGGGYYDRTFAFLRETVRPSRPILAGIGYARQEIDRIEPRDWDVRLDYVATERELVDLTQTEA